MNLLNSSVNLENSLLQNFDFEHNIVDQNELEKLTLEQTKELYKVCQTLLNNVKELKHSFISTTPLREGTKEYSKEIARFNLRKERITKNYLIIENHLQKLNAEKKLNKQQQHQQEEVFLYFFWKTALKNLDVSEYARIVKLTTENVPMPETLMGSL